MKRIKKPEQQIQVAKSVDQDHSSNYMDILDRLDLNINALNSLLHYSNNNQLCGILAPQLEYLENTKEMVEIMAQGYYKGSLEDHPF